MRKCDNVVFVPCATMCLYTYMSICIYIYICPPTPACKGERALGSHDKNNDKHNLDHQDPNRDQKSQFAMELTRRYVALDGFRRDVLTPAPREKWGENSFPGMARPCGFTVATCFLVGLWNCKNQVTEAGSRIEAGTKTLLVRNGFRRDVLTSEPGEKWAKIAFLDRPGHAGSPLRRVFLSVAGTAKIR